MARPDSEVLYPSFASVPKLGCGLMLHWIPSFDLSHAACLQESTIDNFGMDIPCVFRWQEASQKFFGSEPLSGETLDTIAESRFVPDRFCVIHLSTQGWSMHTPTKKDS